MFIFDIYDFTFYEYKILSKREAVQKIAYFVLKHFEIEAKITSNRQRSSI